MNITELINKQINKEKEYEICKTNLQNQISELQEQLNNLHFPHWTDMLSEVVKELNAAIADRGFAFMTDDYHIFGLDPSCMVVEDSLNSVRSANCYLRFEFRNDKLFCREDDYKIEEIHAIEDIIAVIDRKRAEFDRLAAEKLESYGSIENMKAAILRNEESFFTLPESEQTEDFLIQYIGCEPCSLEFVPVGMLTYPVLQAWIHELGNHMQLSNRFYYILESEKIRNLFDNALFTEALQYGANLYPYFSKKELERLDAFNPANVMLTIKYAADVLNYIPAEYMKPEYFGQLTKSRRHLTIKLNKLPGIENISQETAEQIFSKHPEVFPSLPDKFKTLAMCHEAVRYMRSYKEAVPAAFLTPKDNLKSLPKTKAKTV